MEINVYLNDTKIPIGIFEVYSQDGVKLIAYDCMKRLDKDYATSLLYPNNLTNVFNEVLSKCGITKGTVTIPNVTIQNQLVGTTYRDVFSECCKIMGCNAMATRDNKLLLKWFDNTGAKIMADNQYSQEIGKNYYTVSTFVCIKSDGSVVTSGNSNRTLSFTSDYVTKERLDTIAGNCAMSYKSCEIDMIGDPTIDIGDIIQVEDTSGNLHEIAVMDDSFYFDGGCKNTIKSIAETANQTEYGTKNNIINKIFDIQKSVNGLKVTLSEEYADKTYVSNVVNIATGELTSQITQAVKDA